jgi:uncharacterized membrane protein
MRKHIFTIILSLFCTYIYAEEIPNINVQLIYPRNIKSNGNEFFDLSIKNYENIVFYNLELSVLNDDSLEIILDKKRIAKLEPNETITINMEIINTYKYYFSKDAFITFKISNDEFTKEIRYQFTIKPVEKFWFLIILSIALITAILFVLIFIKINKGEENVR